MDLRFTPEQDAFRADARAFLEDRLAAGRPFEVVRGRGGPGDEHDLFEERWEWEQELGRHRWIGLGWVVIEDDAIVAPSVRMPRRRGLSATFLKVPSAGAPAAP